MQQQQLRIAARLFNPVRRKLVRRAHHRIAQRQPLRRPISTNNIAHHPSTLHTLHA
jgi:hypothetical protein